MNYPFKTCKIHGELTKEECYPKGKYYNCRECVTSYNKKRFEKLKIIKEKQNNTILYEKWK